MAHAQSLCRDCGWSGPDAAAARCARCGSPRIVGHAELHRLTIAHVDCDAFYASVEKRDDPSLGDKPVIIGGGRRGVVSTACYVARIRGVKSAMPMFKARERCPDAVVIKPDMEKYVAVSRQIRAKMDALTPLVEPLSLDEAFLDLTGTERLHQMSPAASLAQLAREIEAEIGVTVSIGLAPNKFLSKIASDLDKPRGFHVIGAADAQDFLAQQPVTVIWGVGKAFAETLRRDGFQTIADLRSYDAAELTKRYGAMGARLARLCWGEDAREVSPDREAKSISSETTFNDDLTDADLLDAHLWRLTEKVSARLKAKRLEGRVVTVKLKTARFKIITRRVTLPQTTCLADSIYRAATPLLERECVGRFAYRLLGVSVSSLCAAPTAEGLPARQPDMLEAQSERRADAERAIDTLRERFGADSVLKGRSLRT